LPYHNQISLKQRWKVLQGATTYYCTFGDVMKGRQAELLTSDFEEKLKAYNAAGTEIMSMPFSSSILTFFIASVTSPTSREVITLDADGNVAMFPLKAGRGSEPTWMLRLSSPVVAAATGDFTGNGHLEIVCGLEGRRLVIVDKDGTVTMDMESPGGEIKSLAAGDFDGDGHQEFAVVDTIDKFFLIHNGGSVEVLPSTFAKKVLHLRSVRFLGFDYLLCCCQDNKLYIADAKETIVLESPRLDAEIATIAAGKFTSQEIDDVAVAFENGTLAVFEPVLSSKDKLAMAGVRQVAGRGQQSTEQTLAGKLKRILDVSKRVSLGMIRDVLKLEKETFSERIVEWAHQFGFKIDGDYVILENADIDGFIAELDKSFASWDSKTKAKDGKV
jgi:hypothetical protein